MMLSAILNWLSGGLLDKLLGFFSDRERQRLEMLNSEQQRAHEQSMAARQASKEIRLATAGFWEMRLVTFLIAFPFTFHLWTIWLDTQFKLDWNIDKFPAPFDEWEGAILLSFFGVSAIGLGAQAIAGAIAYRRK